MLLGHNGSGKTTLLNLISMVLRSDFSALREERFEIEFELSNEHGRLIGEIKNDPTSHDDTIISEPLNELTRWCTAYRFRSESSQGVVEVSSDGTSTRQTSDAGPAKTLPVARLIDVPFLYVMFGGRSLVASDGAFVSSVFWSNSAFRFDEALETYFAVIDDDRAGRDPFVAPAARLLTGDRAGAGVSIRSGSHSRFSVGRILQPISPIPSVGVVEMNSTSQAYAGSNISHLPELFGFAGMTVGMTVLESFDDAMKQRWYELGHLAFSFTRKDGTVQRHDLLSFGQKRLLAFMYYLDVNPDFVVADELVNGMHHSWIEACVEAMKGRQVFLASQNPLLLDFLEFSSIEQVQRTFVRCQVDRSGEAEQILWGNFSDEAAARFFESYQVGIQHVNEILRTEGLW